MQFITLQLLALLAFSSSLASASFVPGHIHTALSLRQASGPNGRNHTNHGPSVRVQCSEMEKLQHVVDVLGNSTKLSEIAAHNNLTTSEVRDSLIPHIAINTASLP